MASRKKRKKRAPNEKKAPNDEVLAQLIQIRDELRAARAQWKAAAAPLQSLVAETAVPALRPELEAVLSTLRQSAEELKQTVRDELGDRTIRAPR